MKRNGHKVMAKKGVNIFCKWANWCIYPDFELLYNNETYEELEKS